MTTPNALIVMRGLRPGSATAWPEDIEGEETLVFGVREESRRIAALGSPVETELRAAAEWIERRVLVVPLVLRLGPLDPAGENLYELWLNAHANDMPSVFALARQSRLVTRLFGDGCALERTIACPNSRRGFFVRAASLAADVPPWPMDDFDRAKEDLQARFPSVQSLWESMRE